MATIGTFIRTENGFTGSVKTLTINVRGVRFVPIEDPVENGPVFRVFAGNAEFGAAWKKRSDRGSDFYSVKLDDPSFPKPIYAGLFEAEGEDLVLAWSRRSRPDETE